MHITIARSTRQSQVTSQSLTADGRQMSNATVKGAWGKTHRTPTQTECFQAGLVYRVLRLCASSRARGRMWNVGVLCTKLSVPTSTYFILMFHPLCHHDRFASSPCAQAFEQLLILKPQYDLKEFWRNEMWPSNAAVYRGWWSPRVKGQAENEHMWGVHWPLDLQLMLTGINDCLRFWGLGEHV